MLLRSAGSLSASCRMAAYKGGGRGGRGKKRDGVRCGCVLDYDCDDISVGVRGVCMCGVCDPTIRHPAILHYIHTYIHKKKNVPCRRTGGASESSCSSPPPLAPPAAAPPSLHRIGLDWVVLCKNFGRLIWCIRTHTTQTTPPPPQQPLPPFPSPPSPLSCSPIVAPCGRMTPPAATEPRTTTYHPSSGLGGAPRFKSFLWALRYTSATSY